MGKILEMWFLYGSMVLARMSKDAYEGSPESHRGEKGDGCAPNHPHGIICYCFEDCMTRRICDS